jgi:hypothetical protein
MKTSNLKSTSPIVSAPPQPTNANEQTHQTQPQGQSLPGFSGSPHLPSLSQAQQTGPQVQQQSEQVPLGTREGEEFVDYATRCALKLDPLSPADMHTVKVGTKAMGDTRETLPLRGNVLEDAIKTRDMSVLKQSAARTTAGKEYSGDMLRYKIKKFFWPSKAETLADIVNKKRFETNMPHSAITGSGNCGEFAALTARNVASNLSPGETAKHSGLNSTMPDGKSVVDHAIARIVQPEGSDNSNVFLLDAWAKGSGVRYRDAPPTIKGPGNDYESFSPEQGPKLLSDFDASVSAFSTKNGAAMTRTLKDKTKEIAQKVEKRDKNKPQNSEDPYESLYAKNPKMSKEINTTSREFEEESQAAAKLVKAVQGPREEHKAVVDGVDEETNYAQATAVNEMVPQLAAEMGISVNAAAKNTAQAVENIALKDPRPQEEEWVTIRRS